MDIDGIYPAGEEPLGGPQPFGSIGSDRGDIPLISITNQITSGLST
ncbi:MAG: hypothetical protein LC725_06115 [Lentisphaerae bacterium]|nr:hypothetical protein [Lentisphaerota bacterium]